MPDGRYRHLTGRQAGRFGRRKAAPSVSHRGDRPGPAPSATFFVKEWAVRLPFCTMVGTSVTNL